MALAIRKRNWMAAGLVGPRERQIWVARDLRVLGSMLNFWARVVSLASSIAEGAGVPLADMRIVPRRWLGVNWGVAMATKIVNGTELFYEERGGGMAVVLLHGFPLDLRVWEGQVGALSDRWRVITVDMRGFGRSRSEAPFTIESLGDDVHGLLGGIGALTCLWGGR